MEGDELHEVIERLEHAEHERHNTLRATVTLLILVVTVLTAITGLLAARANRHNADAERQRAVHTVESQDLSQRSYELYGQFLDLEAADTAAYQRSTVETRYAQQGTTLPSAHLKSEAGAWSKQAGVFNGKLTGLDLASANAAPVVPQQEAFSDGRAADAWISKEDANVGVAGLFAVCLFLLGLALTVPGRTVKWAFVGIAVLLTSVGVIRGLVVNVSGVHEVPESAIEAYHAGTLATFKAQSAADTKAADESTAAATEEFKKAVAADPSYVDGWVALGESQSVDQTDKAGLRAAVTSYEKALSLGDDGFITHNNLGYAYLLLGNTDKAREEIDKAHELEPEQPFIMMSEAEVSLAEGDDATAELWTDRSVERLVEFDSDFRNQFFASLRANDRPALLAAGVSADRLDTLFNHLRDVEASLDVYHSPTPHDLNGGSVSNLKATYQSDRGRYEITFDANNVHQGDVLTTRVYNTANEQYSPYSSAPHLIDLSADHKVDPIVANTPIDQGTWRIEIYLNGHFQSSVTVQSPGDF